MKRREFIGLLSSTAALPLIGKPAAMFPLGDQFMIDGVVMGHGPTLAWRQYDPGNDGIYTVSAGKWSQ